MVGAARFHHHHLQDGRQAWRRLGLRHARPDGRDYQNRITYLEVVKPERLVYKHGGDEDLEPVSFQTTVTFVPQGSKTMVTMRAVFPTAEERNRVVKEYGAVEGGKRTLARLDEHLSGAARSTPTSRAFVISRVFDAPRESA